MLQNALFHAFIHPQNGPRMLLTQRMYPPFWSIVLLSSAVINPCGRPQNSGSRRAPTSVGSAPAAPTASSMP
jgi:hypothetical protein